MIVAAIGLSLALLVSLSLNYVFASATVRNIDYEESLEREVVKLKIKIIELKKKVGAEE